MTYALLRPAHHRRLHHGCKPESLVLTINTLFLLLILLAAAPAFAQVPSGDTMAGRRLVETQCRACHDGEGSLSTPHQGPSLRAVAAMPSTTSMSLHAFLLTPHAKMPDYRLTSEEIDDVVAYILSLRR
jgi:mono/diheme cytochrome c family protein